MPETGGLALEGSLFALAALLAGVAEGSRAEALTRLLYTQDF
jgi:hypothetical protein